jgi:hypothetical protein
MKIWKWNMKKYIVIMKEKEIMKIIIISNKIMKEIWKESESEKEMWIIMKMKWNNMKYRKWNSMKIN